jgi:hypothetical protein
MGTTAVALCITVCAVLISVSGCGLDDHPHELRAQCGRDARATAAALASEYRQDQSHWTAGMNSHYS